MSELDGDVAARVAELAADRTAGAAALASRALRLVRDVQAVGRPLAPLARALCRAQPSMAPLWTLAAEALAADRDPSRLDRFAGRLERSSRSLVRVATEHLAPADGVALRVVTISASGSVHAVLEALGRRHQVHVSCCESRPALEGRVMAAQLASAGMPVRFFSDAAIAHALTRADAVLVGADAVAPAWVMNKSGTFMLAAAAALRGVPVYVLATRDKFVAEPIAQRLVIRDERPEEIWETAPDGVEVRNPYFERIPADLVSAVVTDVGVLGTGMLADACASAVEPAAVEALIELLDGR